LPPEHLVKTSLFDLIDSYPATFSRRTFAIATPNRRYVPRQQVEEPFKINQKITAREVRLVGDNIEQGIYPIDQARKFAQDQNLDLVEISPTATPPVCRVIDYSKFKYEQKKKTRELKAKQTKVVIKEIRFGPNTDDHDFEFKVKHAKEFLKEGAKIKSYVHFVGRSIVFKERGEILLLKFAQALEDLAKVEQLPKLEGKRMFLYLAPKAAVVAKPAPKPAAAADKDKAPKEAKPAPAKEKEEAPAAATE
jgi:translation initiation factor IF-3